VVHCSSKHNWILASNIDCKKGVVNIYDSLFTSLDEETLSYFGANAKFSIGCKRSRSKLGKNCGMFAIVFLTLLAYNQKSNIAKIS